MVALITEEELATKLKKAPRTVREWRVIGLIPFYRIGRSILYSEARVEEALKKFERRAK